ncbi:ATP-binding cassette domain-containing protein [Candidatus Pseudothioglobus singularis]|nr:ATP-binding cassette domain-containing protein [Candidatus Pseudothioglobus singularis]MDB4821481.1 ATP-binding cassette domain-containing protein [Candidatus Pseudothioglobus singularis]
MNIIDLQNITVFQGRNKVLDNFSLTIDESQSTVILGPNGSGKTTLLKLLNRELYIVENPRSSLKIFEKDKWNVDDLRSNLGVVSQYLQHGYSESAIGLYVVLSGFYSSDGIWQHQKFEDEKLNRAQEVMDLLSISDLQDRAFSSMSTGEQRKFLLARSLVNDPAVLVFDEPTSGLDMSTCFQYLEIIRELISMGKKVVLVTHHVHEIPPEVTRVILLKEGEIIDDGNKDEILTNASLTNLFDWPIKVIKENGYYQAMPG